MKKIFLLEDDYSLNETIKEMLEDDGFLVNSFYDGQKAFDNVASNYFLYIFDINVPNIDGIDVLKKVKNMNPNAKVIIISANINIDKISQAYENGCDDYIKKPFDIKELKLKINKLLNAFYLVKLSENIFFNMDRKILYHNNNEIHLTKNEKNLIYLLLANKKEIVSKTQIEEFIYDGVVKSSEAIRSFIKRVRQKIPADLIVTVTDRGYYIA